jgi:hypothetical protein
MDGSMNRVEPSHPVGIALRVVLGKLAVQVPELAFEDTMMWNGAITVKETTYAGRKPSQGTGIPHMSAVLGRKRFGSFHTSPNPSDAGGTDVTDFLARLV